MSQFARPDLDTTLGNYEDHLGGTSNIFETLDESTPDDGDFIASEFSPSASPYTCRLSDVTDPTVSTGHIVRYRTRKDPPTGAQVDLTVELRQGYVSEASLGTLIASEVRVNLPTVFTTYTFTLSGAEADAITDYTDLFLRFLANQP